MLERGIAYRKKAPVNWCPSCQTVLANEQAEGGECWRCHSKVEEREMDQWFLRITAYQDELVDDMAQLPQWPERVLQQQRNWVGRSHGAEVDFPVEGGEPLHIFTTRIDTIFGATFMVVAPEHPRVEEFVRGAKDEGKTREAIQRLRGQDRRARQAGQVEKEGVFTGRYATNPFSGERIPIWVGNFVLTGYGTGAIMAVPGHDERDFEFARKFGLPIKAVVMPPDDWLRQRNVPPGEHASRIAVLPEAFAGDGRAIQSANRDVSLDGLPTPEAKKRITDWLQTSG